MIPAYADEKMLTAKEKQVLRIIQGTLPLSKRPFASVAREAKVTEAEVIRITSDLLTRGLLRKFSAILRHQRAGWERNALVVWSAPGNLCEQAGKALAAFPEVTHCYERKPPFLGRYNLFTMVHLRDHHDEDCFGKMAAASGLQDYLVLESVFEFKKTSMEYC